MILGPHGDLLVGRWWSPRERRLRLVSSSVLLIVLPTVVGVIVVLRGGSPEALVAGGIGLLLCLAVRLLPAVSGQLIDGELRVATAFRQWPTLAVAAVSSVRPARFYAPIVVFEGRDGQRLPLLVTGSRHAFVAAVRPMLPIGADDLPAGTRWITSRARVWFVLLIWTLLHDADPLGS